MNYTIPEIDYSTFGEHGFTTIRVSVVGFWSNPVEIYVRRESRYGKPPEWIIEVMHSSGGYENCIDKLDAEYNFAQAILAAIEVSKEIKSNSHILEANFESRRKIEREIEDARQAEIQSKVDADTEITQEQIDRLMKDFTIGNELHVFDRGSDCGSVFEKSISTGRIYFTRYGKKQSISTVELRALLIGKSARSKGFEKV